MPKPDPDNVVINERIEQDREQILEASKKGTAAKVGVYARLSGPGWLQSAITLGGGSLAGSLYLGMIAGVSLLWIQPLAMIFGIIMLSAIGYVVLSTGKRPFRAINEHINPVLGWSWAIAAMLANFVWTMPQYALGNAALQQNLFPGLFGADHFIGNNATIVCTAALFLMAGIVVWFYNSGGWGIKLFETILKIMIGVVVLSFFGVVARMAMMGELEWTAIFSGLVPEFRYLFQPAETLTEYIAATGEFASHWHDWIVSAQRDRIITVIATAVGINMTFMLPYSMLARGWDRDFRGLAMFDLSTGLFVPFLLATSCVVIAAASQFHATPNDILERYHAGEITIQEAIDDDEGIVNDYFSLLDGRLEAELGTEAFAALDDDEKAALREELPDDDKWMAATLVQRDANHLALSLERLTGPVYAQLIFGIGVFGMAMSTIIVLAVVNGFVICEILNVPSKGTPHRIGSYLCLAVGALGPFVWAGAYFYLAVPTSVFGGMLIPIAYVSFFLLMNNEKLLGEHMPRGTRRIVWNTFMGLAVVLVGLAALWAIGSRTGEFPFIGIQQRWVAFGIIVIMAAIGTIIHFKRKAAEGRGNETGTGMRNDD